MKVKQHGPKIEEMKRQGCTRKEIAEATGLQLEQIKGYLKRSRAEQRKRGHPRSKKEDAQKTNQELRNALKRLRMEVALLRDFQDAMERK